MLAYATGLILGVALAAQAAVADTLRLDGLDQVSGDATVPPGWRLRAVGGEHEPVARLFRRDGRIVLSLEAQAAAGQCWRELDDPIPPGEGRLSWRWRISEHLAEVDLRDPDRDDAPARLFVVFGRGRLFSRPRMLFYTWGGAEPVGSAFPSHASDRLGVVVVRNAQDLAEVWHDESRDVASDYRAAFGEEAPDITAVGIMLDTDQLHGRASVELAELLWVSDDLEGR